MSTSTQVDQYILNAEPFAQPILHHLRALVHHACPLAEERIKWGFPHFDYRGAPMCSMAAFKQHCAFGFWKASLIKDPSLLDKANEESSMGHLGKIRSITDLPSDKKLIAWMKEAMAINEKGIKVPKIVKPKAEILMPPEFKTMLTKNKNALHHFEVFTKAAQREYLEWITDAKTDATKEKRMLQALEWIAEGKKRNWKYEK